MPQTIRQYLQQLPEPYQSQAIANVNPQDNLDSERAFLFLSNWILDLDWPMDVSSVIKGSFDWKSSREGQAYWKKVCEKLDNEEPLI